MQIEHRLEVGACYICAKLSVSLYYHFDNTLKCHLCLPLSDTEGPRARKLIGRSINTLGKTQEQIEAFCERIRKSEAAASPGPGPAGERQRPRRSIFKKAAPHQKVVDVFLDEEVLSPSGVASRLPFLSERSVKGHLKAAVKSGDLIQIGRGQYRRPAKVQKTLS